MKKIKIISDITSQILFKNFINQSNNIEFHFLHSSFDEFLLDGELGENFDGYICHFSPYFLNFIEISNKIEKINQILNKLKKINSKTSSLVIINQILNYKYTFSLNDDLITKDENIEVNSIIYDFIRNSSSIILFDLEKISNSLDLSENLSKRNYDIMRMPYSKKFNSEILNEYNFHLSSYFLPKKKVIIVDADNTLWDGILGEDGYENIKIGNEYPGSIYFDFQTSLKNLKKNGTLLCLCTKNNLDDIKEAFTKKNMPLSLDDFLIVKSNWEPKSKNIMEIIKSLNIGQDSAVFIDDNPFEIGEVSSAIPDLLCLKFDISDPNKSENIFKFEPSLYKHVITSEDLKKTDVYKADQKRENFRLKSVNQDDYISGLNLKITLEKNNPKHISRASQLTQKTNQFNLTCNRYSENDIKKFMKNNVVLTFSAKDKYGDLGIIGVSIIIKNKIDTFLLSCRAFGRKIEIEMLKKTINHIDDNKILAEFILNKKNKMVKNFYLDNGFKVFSDEKIKKQFFLKRI